MAFDLMIRHGDIVTAADRFQADIGIAGGKIVAVGTDLPDGQQVIDARGLTVMPGGVDAHCHIEEPPYLGAELADDFIAATRGAACGGTTTIIPFVNQLTGKGLRFAVEDYRAKARDKALIDYAFHIILSNVSDALLGQELPALIEDGYRSVKVFMTYPGYMLDDRQIMDVMEVTRRFGGVTMVHAENGQCIHWLADRLEAAGKTDLGSFAASAPEAVEREATHRAITLAELTGARIMLVHVSSAQAMQQVQWAQSRGLQVLAETCPQYLIDHEAQLHDDGWEPAKYMCSPPPRGGENAGRLWSGLSQGAFQLVSSDHCAYRFDGHDGKKSQGDTPHFRHVPPGLPGLETRLPLLFQEGVVEGRLSPQQFVALTATNPARIYGLYPRKGSIMPGADADIALWDTKLDQAIRHSRLHDDCDYSPFEGHRITAWPVTTISRGEIVWNRGWVSTAYGRGAFLPQEFQPRESHPQEIPA